MTPEEMLEQAKAAQKAMSEMKSMLQDMKPYVGKVQEHIVKGEKPPNDLLARAYKTIAEATDRAIEHMPDVDPNVIESNQNTHRLADAYANNDDMEIAIAHASSLGHTFRTIEDLVDTMLEMFTAIVGDAEENWSPPEE